MIGRFCKKIGDSLSFGRLFAVALVVGLLSAAQPAQAQVVLEDLGLDLTDYVTAAGTMLGTVIGAALVLWFGVMITRRGIAWISTATRK